MKREIEQVVSCDEAARAAVERAKEEARRLLEAARQDASGINAEFDEKMGEFKAAEIDPIMENARQEARNREVQAREYVDRLERLAIQRKHEIVEEFLRDILKG